MQEIPDIRIEDYAYPLTDDRIAKYPLAERDASKLLRYKAGEVDEWIFRELPALAFSGRWTENSPAVRPPAWTAGSPA